MDPDGRWTSTRAVLLAAAGQNCWPPAGSYMAATGQDLMAADTTLARLLWTDLRPGDTDGPAVVAVKSQHQDESAGDGLAVGSRMTLPSRDPEPAHATARQLVLRVWHTYWLRTVVRVGHSGDDGLRVL